MPDYLFHYTSVQGAQEIMATGYLTPGKDGTIYLTEELYSSGGEAVDWLAITGKAIQIIAAIPRESFESLAPSKPVVGIDAENEPYRKGAGREVTVKAPISADDIIWMATLPP